MILYIHSVFIRHRLWGEKGRGRSKVKEKSSRHSCWEGEGDSVGATGYYLKTWRNTENVVWYESGGGADCQKNKWAEKDRWHFRPDPDGFGPCGGMMATLAIRFWLGLSCNRKMGNHIYTHTTHSSPICLSLCLALTQNYHSHHSSHVILLRGTIWTLSLQDCLGTQVIFYPSSHTRVRGRKKMREKQWRRGTRIYLYSPRVRNMLVQLPQAKSTMDAYTAPVSASCYLLDFVVHRVLREVDLHKLHKAHRGHLLVWVHMVLLDLGLHNHHRDLLVNLLHLCMGLKMEIHRDHCLPHTEHLVVGCFLLGSPEVTENSTRFIWQLQYPADIDFSVYMKLVYEMLS